MSLTRITLTPIEPFLDAVVGAGATDLMLSASSPPRMRIDGRLRPIPGTATLSIDDVELIIYEVLPAELKAELQKHREIDFSFSYRDTHRFRGNCFFQRGIATLALRAIPLAIPTFKELRLPVACERFCQLPQGLVLFTGPTGSGKSTTLASMIDFINQRRECHILSIEDPIEYVHEHKSSVVNQREVGYDTPSFERALRSALREDPDVILIGEMRDPETVQIALTLSETGHLVYASLHTNDASQALDRICDVFSEDRQAQIRTQLAASLAGIISQRLVPKIGGGMVAAFEVLVVNDAARNLIREGKTHHLRNVMLGNRSAGMITLETSLNLLIKEGLVTVPDAMSRAIRPREIVQARTRAV
jgi:twitching motility protein PilT